MGRIRSIKPEFFKHENLFDAEIETGFPLRIAFAGLWTCCDREGRFEWRPRALKTDILPYDELDFSRVLDALEASGFVQRYTVNGKEYGCVPGFNIHQVVNQREAKSKIPPNPDACASTCKHGDNTEPTEHIPSGVNLPNNLRQKIINRDGGRCVRCGSKDDLTVDHIFPKSVGGTHAETNLRCLCRKCNSARPVSGDALKKDLESDGLSWDDMERMCTHVQAHGEGEGEREDVGVGSARADSTFRERLLVAMGHDESGLTANGQIICNSAQMLEVERWFTDLSLTEAEVLSVVSSTPCQTGPPNSPKYYSVAMQKFAGEKNRPPLKAIEGSSNDKRTKPSKQSERVNAFVSGARGTP